MNNLVWCSPHPNHYNIYLFTHISKINGIKFEAVYFKKTLEKYPWKTDFKGDFKTSFLRSSFIGIDFTFIFKSLFSKKNQYLVAGLNEPTMFIMLSLLMFLNKPFYVYSDTPPLKSRQGLKQLARKIWMKWLYKKVKFYLVTGQPGIEALLRLGVPNKKIINFPFATNNEFFIPSNKEYRKGFLIFISSGRLVNSHKGYNVALKAFHLLKKNHPEYKFQYYIAGEGPDRTVIEELLKQYGLDEEVKLLGWLEPEQLIEFYHSGNVFIHPSYFDPYPNAVLEAMSCGLPVIGSDAAGSAKDRVIEGVNGYVFQAGDPNDLYLKLKILINLDEKELKNMSYLSRKESLKWSIDYHVNKIKEIFEKTYL